MTDHSEFPWGPQYEPGLLTPFGVIGWVVATALLLLLVLRLRESSGGKAGDAHLQEMHKVILQAARYALKQDEYGILQGAKVLRRTISFYLGGLLMASEPIGKQAKALALAMGEKDEKKDDKAKGGHGKDAHGKDAHGKGAHAAHGGHGGHGAPAEHAHAHAHAAAAPGVAAHTVQGHSITVNVGGEGGAHHEEPHEEEEEKPLSLEEQLIACRKAVREFEAWWSDKQARIAQLKAAQDALTIPRKPDPALIALFEEKK